MKLETACIHAIRDKTHTTGAVPVPIYQAATFAHPGVGQSTGYDLIHSGTKYLSGHNDTLAGFLVAKSPEILERLRFLEKTTGAVLSPFDAFLVVRGIKTLAVRMEKSQENTLTVARWLKEQRKVTTVRYAGLPEHPAYELSRRQARGFGSMISFSLDSAETARCILNNTEMILFAESLGGGGNADHIPCHTDSFRRAGSGTSGAGHRQQAAAAFRWN